MFTKRQRSGLKDNNVLLRGKVIGQENVLVVPRQRVNKAEPIQNHARPEPVNVAPELLQILLVAVWISKGGFAFYPQNWSSSNTCATNPEHNNQSGPKEITTLTDGKGKTHIGGL